MVARSTLTLLLAAAGAHAHFTVGYPKPLSSSHDEQGTGPCGGITPDLATAEVTDFHVGGDNVATRTSHAQGNWLYRVTLDPRAAGNWTQVYPIVQQSGLGDFCAPLVSVPGEFVGKKGILSVVGGGGHGYLYAVRNPTNVKIVFFLPQTNSPVSTSVLLSTSSRVSVKSNRRAKTVHPWPPSSSTTRILPPSPRAPVLLPAVPAPVTAATVQAKPEAPPRPPIPRQAPPHRPRFPASPFFSPPLWLLGFMSSSSRQDISERAASFLYRAFFCFPGSSRVTWR